MRVLLDFEFPLEPFNSMVKDGTVGKKLEQAIGDIKPEAVYFTARNGKRGGTMVVDLADASKIAALAEPLFLGFEASVQLHPCMTAEDLAKAGLDEMGKNYK